MTPEDFIATIADPNIAEALRAPADDRLVFNACAAIEALASAIYWIRKDAGLTTEPKDSGYKTDLSTRSEPFEIVHAIAESQKHGRLTFSSSSGRPVTDATNVNLQPHGLNISPLGDLMLDVGEAISIQHKGQTRTVAPIAQRALGFLAGELVATRALMGKT